MPPNIWLLRGAPQAAETGHQWGEWRLWYALKHQSSSARYRVISKPPFFMNMSPQCTLQCTVKEGLWSQDASGRIQELCTYVFKDCSTRWKWEEKHFFVFVSDSCLSLYMSADIIKWSTWVSGCLFCIWQRKLFFYGT